MAVKPSSALGHWIDATMPEKALALLTANGIDAEELRRRIALALEGYRTAQHVRTNLSERSEEADYARRLADLLAELGRHLTPGAVPARAQALLGWILLDRMSVNAHTLLDRMADDTTTMQAALRIVEKELRAQPTPRGRKREEARGALLGAIVDEITRQSGGPKKRARILALELLEAIGIAAPSSTQQTPHKAAERARKQKVRK
jgi:hypothetical protein